MPVALPSATLGMEGRFSEDGGDSGLVAGSSTKAGISTLAAGSSTKAGISVDCAAVELLADVAKTSLALIFHFSSMTGGSFQLTDLPRSLHIRVIIINVKFHIKIVFTLPSSVCMAHSLMPKMAEQNQQ